MAGVSAVGTQLGMPFYMLNAPLSLATDSCDVCVIITAQVIAA